MGHRVTGEHRVSGMESQGAAQEEAGTKEKLHERNGGSIMSPTDLALKLSPDLFTSSDFYTSLCASLNLESYHHLINKAVAGIDDRAIW